MILEFKNPNKEKPDLVVPMSFEDGSSSWMESKPVIVIFKNEHSEEIYTSIGIYGSDDKWFITDSSNLIYDYVESGRGILGWANIPNETDFKKDDTVEEERIYRKVLREYRIEDAKIQVERFKVESIDPESDIAVSNVLNGFLEEDYEGIVNLFEDNEDCNVPENDTWEIAIREYVDFILEERKKNIY